MVNFGLNSASILGIFLAVAGASLYFMRSMRPELARDHDIFFAAVGLLCGFILLFQGWRLDPILQFGQFLLTGSAVFFAVESIRLRGVATEQARRNTPIVDRDRPVSRTRVYTEAELDKIDPYDNYSATPNYDSPRLRGYEDESASRSSRRSPQGRRSTNSDYRDEPPRRSSRNRPDRDRSEATDTRPSRRRSSVPPTRGYDGWQDRDEWSDEPQARSPRSRTRPISRDERYVTDTPNPPRSTSPGRVNPNDLGRSYDYDVEPQDDYDSNSSQGYDAGLGRSYEDESEITADYVDYQSLERQNGDYTDDYDDYPEPEADNHSDRPREGGDNSERNRPIDFDY